MIGFAGFIGGIRKGEALSRETVQSVTLWANETFGLASIDAQFRRVLDELDELSRLFDQERTVGPRKIAEEAADVVICLYRIIGTLDPDAIEKKMAINRKRKWIVDGQGCAQHVEEL